MENHWQRVTMAIDISSVVIDVDVEMFHHPSPHPSSNRVSTSFRPVFPLGYRFVFGLLLQFPVIFPVASKAHLQRVFFSLQAPESIRSRSRMNVNVCLNDWTSQIRPFPATRKGIMAGSRFRLGTDFRCVSSVLLCITMATELSRWRRGQQSAGF